VDIRIIDIRGYSEKLYEIALDRTIRYSMHYPPGSLTIEEADQISLIHAFNWGSCNDYLGISRMGWNNIWRYLHRGNFKQLFKEYPQFKGKKADTFLGIEIHKNGLWE